MEENRVFRKYKKHKRGGNLTFTNETFSLFNGGGGWMYKSDKETSLGLYKKQ